MTNDRKSYFIKELQAHYETIIAGVQRAESSAAQAATAIQDDARRSEDAKGAESEARLAVAHRRRHQQAREELEALLAFAARALPRFGRESAVELGALIDVSIQSDGGTEERTLFMLPVGAGTELSGPGGDGFLSVITPSSPVGRALRGSRIGDSVEVGAAGVYREWTVLDLS
jgi:transcription elongation GreA/GreB family factor